MPKPQEGWCGQEVCQIRYYIPKVAKSKRAGYAHFHVPVKKALFKYVPRGQRMNEDCILCPKEKHINLQYDLLVHVRRVHVGHLITIRNTNLLMCRYSDIRSQGTDNSVHN